MSTLQMVPEKTQAEGKLMNIFDKVTMTGLVYFELCIVMDYRTKKPDYKHLVITGDAFYLLSQALNEKEPPRMYPYTDVDAIDILPQPPEFLDDEHQRTSKHIAIRISNQLPVDPTVEFFTFYKDTKLEFWLRSSWNHARSREAVTELYGQPKSFTPLSRVPDDSLSTIFSSLQSELVGAKKRIARALLIEELTVGIGSFPPKAFKKLLLSSDGFLSFIFSEITDVNRTLKFYFTDARPDGALSSADALTDTIYSGLEVPRDQYTTVKYGLALYVLLAKLISGSEVVGAPRVNLLLTAFNGMYLMPDLLNLILLEAPTVAPSASSAPPPSASGTVISFGGGAPPTTVPASQLELIGSNYMADVVERKQRLESRKKDVAAQQMDVKSGADAKTTAEKKKANDANPWAVDNVKKAVDLISLRLDEWLDAQVELLNSLYDVHVQALTFAERYGYASAQILGAASSSVAAVVGSGPQTAPWGPDIFLKQLMSGKKSVFVEKLLPRYVNRLLKLLSGESEIGPGATAASASASAASAAAANARSNAERAFIISQYATLLERVMIRSAELRKSLKKQFASELVHTSANEKARWLATPMVVAGGSIESGGATAFYYKRSRPLLTSILKWLEEG